MGLAQDLARLKLLLEEVRAHRDRTDLHMATFVWPEDTDRFPVYGSGTSLWVLWEPTKAAAFNVMRNGVNLVRDNNNAGYTVTEMRGGITKFTIATALVAGEVLQTWGQMRTDRRMVALELGTWGSVLVAASEISLALGSHGGVSLASGPQAAALSLGSHGSVSLAVYPPAVLSLGTHGSVVVLAGAMLTVGGHGAVTASAGPSASLSLGSHGSMAMVSGQ